MGFGRRPFLPPTGAVSVPANSAGANGDKRSRPFLKDKPKMFDLRKPPLAEFAVHALDARARAKTVVAQMQGIRNPASPAAIQIADDLMAIANSFELLSNDVRYAAKVAAANRAR